MPHVLIEEFDGPLVDCPTLSEAWKPLRHKKYIAFFNRVRVHFLSTLEKET